MKKCYDCGAEQSIKGAPMYCDICHDRNMKQCEHWLRMAEYGLEPLTRCSNCHTVSPLEASYFIKDTVTLCKSCYEKDWTLKKWEEQGYPGWKNGERS
jgi:hypothetical protein